MFGGATIWNVSGTVFHWRRNGFLVREDWRQRGCDETFAYDFFGQSETEGSWNVTGTPWYGICTGTGRHKTQDYRGLEEKMGSRIQSDSKTIQIRGRFSHKPPKIISFGNFFWTNERRTRGYGRCEIEGGEWTESLILLSSRPFRRWGVFVLYLPVLYCTTSSDGLVLIFLIMAFWFTLRV